MCLKALTPLTVVNNGNQKWLMCIQLTHKVGMWKQCSSPQSSSQWMSHKCVSPSDAWPDGKWLAGCLRGIKVWRRQHVRTVHGEECTLPVLKHTPARTDERLIVFTQNSPLKFPLITYGMMPSGHTRSGLEVAALLRRWRLRLSAALLLLTDSLEVELLTVTSALEICADSRPFIWTELLTD